MLVLFVETLKSLPRKFLNDPHREEDLAVEINMAPTIRASIWPKTNKRLQPDHKLPLGQQSEQRNANDRWKRNHPLPFGTRFNNQAELIASYKNV